MKKTIPYIILLLFLIPIVLSYTISDNFNDGVVNNQLWTNVTYGSASSTLREGIFTTFEDIVVYATQDSYMDKDNPGVNYGSSTTLLIGRETDARTRRALLEFNPSYIDVYSIDDARLHIYSDTVTGAYNVSIYRVTNDWIEAQVTWDDRVTSTAWGTGGGDFDVGLIAQIEITASTTPYILDITDVVEGWRSGDYPNYGLLLKEETEITDGKRGTINSKEHGTLSRRPFINVSGTYEQDTYGHLKAESRASSNDMYYTTKPTFTIPSGYNATVEVRGWVNVSTMPNNQYLYFCVRDQPTGYQASPPTGCGYCIEAKYNGYGGQFNEWTITKDFPSAAAVVNCDDTQANNWEDIKFIVSRESPQNRTRFEIYFNDDLCMNQTQDTGCQDSDYNITLGYHGSGTTSFEGRWDSLEIETDYTIPVVSGCELPDCVGECLFEDGFDYDCPVEELGYDLIPNNPLLTPEGGKFCYDNTGGGFFEVRKDVYAPNYYSEVSESFDLMIDESNSFVEHKINYYDGSDMQTINIYTIQWFESGGSTYMQYIYDDAVYSLCTDCWILGETHSYSITHWGIDTNDRSFYNASSDSTVAIQPHTWMVSIDNVGSKTYGNIPINQRVNENHSTLLDSFYWSWYQSNVCIDDYVIEVGSGDYDFGTAHQEPRQIGDYCTENTDCLTGLCEYRVCSRKSLGASCTYGWECISRQCNSNYCTKPEIQDALEESIGQNFGYSDMTLSFIALAILIILVVLIVIGSRGSGLGVALGGVLFVIGVMGFAIIGWIHPFIVIGVLLMVIAGIVLMLFIRGGG